jgi:dTDP-4-amino-4,6-dideoxygalactose transaminase
VSVLKSASSSGISLLIDKEIESFEKEFSEYCGVKHAIGCANGLDALKLIIQAYGFGPGDEIIAPANTYIASLISISANGATPVLVEPDINTYLISRDELQCSVMILASMVLYLTIVENELIQYREEVLWKLKRIILNVRHI